MPAPRVRTVSSIRRSWVTSRTVPGKASRACSSCSIAGRSRWLVGSSSTRGSPRGPAATPGPRGCAPRRQRRRRARNAGGSARTWPERPHLGLPPVRPRLLEQGVPERPHQRLRPQEQPACLVDLTDCTPDPSPPLPSSSGRRPSRAPSSVDLPAPLAPVIPTRSAQSTRASMGPSVNPARRTTARTATPPPFPTAAPPRSPSAAPTPCAAPRPRRAARSSAASAGPWPPASRWSRRGTCGRTCRCRWPCVARCALPGPSSCAASARVP